MEHALLSCRSDFNKASAYLRDNRRSSSLRSYQSAIQRGILQKSSLSAFSRIIPYSTLSRNEVLY